MSNFTCTQPSEVRFSFNDVDSVFPAVSLGHTYVINGGQFAVIEIDREYKVITFAPTYADVIITDEDDPDV